jgi:hypothetical protein
MGWLTGLAEGLTAAGIAVFVLAAAAFLASWRVQP